MATAQPGVTVAQAAQQIGVPATSLYPTIRRLQEQNRLAKRGRGLFPA
ncbi:type IV toxin-antitoxin system AbiEi family antitoxin domain-containing protein [Patulibacter sp. NPDC049589]